jgi:hypothetical protein
MVSSFFSGDFTMFNIAAFLTILISFKLFAHPVIYQDGTAFSSSNMPSYSDNYLMYSFSNRWASGLNHWRFTEGNKNTELGLVKLNHLLWRKNGKNFQSNIYLHGGVGMVDSELDRKATQEVYMAGAEVDWETRSLFTSLKHYEFHSPTVTDLSMTQGRVGLSPKIADFKDLQTWVMLQGMYAPDLDRKVMLTPLLRFFYHNVLWELGSSTRGEWMFNFMVHY